MEVRIQPIHFDIAQRLVDHINKKAQRLERHYPNVTVFDVTLKVVKPETAMNKQAIVRLFQPQESEVVADKTADSFEEAVDMAIEAVEHQLEKKKNKK
ncbi:MAG: ribosome-associated translation inhibitor RaiA [Bacteroidales bacterium]|nr:ribosome-associated translation inhibitor RaiA [Bacteroidales bacterium]MBD5245553.1 ribosome-associated translation inhibitor RaiA [Barnesiella sp.]MDE6266117.1 ribosome-associated translation inhibitor RaiA [Muribaculaceae bacterium]